MTQTLLMTIVVSGLGIAFSHAAIPTHWLPFVLTGRAQRWNRRKTLAVTALAGGGHVLFTAILGLLLASLGLALSERIGIWFPRLAGGALLFLGAFYLYRQATGISHSHLPSDHSPSRDNSEHSNDTKQGEYERRMHELAEAKQPAVTTDFFAITTLLALLTFSPCEAFVGFYVVGIRYGWAGFLLLTLVLLIGTVVGMTSFTWLGLVGIRKVNLGLLEKYENALVGGLLGIVGALVVLFEK
jgi:nickel/cobalt transporter (NicO) family protein